MQLHDRMQLRGRVMSRSTMLLLPMVLLLSARLRGINIPAFSQPTGPYRDPAIAAAAVRIGMGGRDRGM